MNNTTCFVVVDAAEQPEDNGNGALVAYSINTGIIATLLAFFVGVFG